MRTTLTIDDQIADSLKQVAHESGKTFKHVVNEVLRAGLQAPIDTSAHGYQLKSVSLGTPKPDMNLDKALHLADALEIHGLFRRQ